MGAHRTGSGWSRDLTAEEAYEERKKRHAALVTHADALRSYLTDQRSALRHEGAIRTSPGGGEIISSPSYRMIEQELHAALATINELRDHILAYEATHKEEE